MKKSKEISNILSLEKLQLDINGFEIMYRVKV